ncbi:CHAT domain-containing protein [Fusarium oxysporum]|nr:CHAT domain-containing protein [Fusarium oxysporum]
MAINLAPHDNPNLGPVYNELIIQLSNVHNNADLDNVTCLFEIVARCSFTDSNNQVIARYEYSAKLLEGIKSRLPKRTDRSSEIASLEDAIRLAERAVDLTPQNHPNLAPRLGGLALRLLSRYDRLGDIKNLEDAIKFAQKAVDLTPHDHPNLATRLNNLARQLSKKYDRLGHTEDLESAVNLAQEAVHVTPDNDHQKLAAFLNSLSDALGKRYRAFGEIEDLNKAINLAERAVDLASSDNADRYCLNNLSSLLLERHTHLGHTEDLEEAIAIIKTAINRTPQDHPDLPIPLSTFSCLLSQRFDRLGEFENMDAAIKLAQRAVDLTPAGHVDKPAYLTRLATLLTGRYEDEHRDNATSSIREALINTPKDHPHRADRLTTGSILWRDLYDILDRASDLKQAIKYAQEAVDLTPMYHTERAARMILLGKHLLCRYMRDNMSKDWDAARYLFMGAADSTAARAHDRMSAARLAIEMLVYEDDLPTANSVVEEALKLLPTLCSRYLSWQDQQHRISQAAGLAAEACSLALRTNDANRALELLEHGRGLIIGHLIDGRGDLSELRKVAPKKADEFERLWYNVVRPTRANLTPEIQQQRLRERVAAEQALEDCLNDIRKISELPDHEQFLLPPSLAYLQNCIGEGTAIVVNVTSISSDALIVDTSGVHHLPLPEVNASEMDDYRKWNLARGATRDGKVVAQLLHEKKFRGFLEQLWFGCVRVVLEYLGFDEPKDSELPRVWWVGTGLASSVPFHAAGIHSPGSIANTISRVISSYTPTIKALGHARARTPPGSDMQSVLLVTMPETPGLRNLPGVTDEEADIMDVLKRSHFEILLRQPNAHTVLEAQRNTGTAQCAYGDTDTLDVVKKPRFAMPLKQPSANRVLEALRYFTIAHFACHGSSDLGDPSNSFLALQGSDKRVPDKLNVQTISDANLENAWLAYLSACSTAEVKASNLADESLHLASSFQVAGFRHVIASMWPADDNICAQVATRFYSELLEKGGIYKGDKAVAAALQTAVTEVRSQNLQRPHLWAQYIHSGA